MPRIATYDAPVNRISPSERGADAATRAGRYVGQYRRQEAEDVRAGGVLQAQGIRQRGWPFDILALLQGKSGAGSGGGGGGRGGDTGGGGGGGGGVKSDGGSRDPFGFGKSDPFDAHGQSSRGAAALGSVARRSGHGGGGGGGGPKVASREQVNPDGSRYKWFSDGSRQIERADGTVIKTDRNGHTSGGGGGGSRGGGGQGLPYTLEHGQFVPAGKDPMTGYNKWAEGQAAEAEKYWNRYYGGPERPTGIEDPVDRYGVPIVRHDENGNPFGPDADYSGGYQPPPSIPGTEGTGQGYDGGGTGGSYGGGRDPVVNEVASWTGQSNSYASDPGDNEAIMERE